MGTNKEKMKAMLSEIKENVQGTNSDGKETGTQRFGTEGRNKQSTRTEWRNKNSKNEERLKNLWDNFKCFNIWIIGVPEGEEEEQEIESFFEQIRKENFLNLVKELDMQVQDAQRRWIQEDIHQGTSSLHYPRLKTRRES